jgi:sensor domain CHASE-containing protein
VAAQGRHGLQRQRTDEARAVAHEELVVAGFVRLAGGKLGEIHGFFMGKSWETYGEMMEKQWENMRKYMGKLLGKSGKNHVCY